MGRGSGGKTRVVLEDCVLVWRGGWRASMAIQMAVSLSRLTRCPVIASTDVADTENDFCSSFVFAPALLGQPERVSRVWYAARPARMILGAFQPPFFLP